MELTGVHHVSINVSDLSEAQPFYLDVLGLEAIPRPDLGVAGTWMTTADGTEIHLIEVPGFEPPKGQHFAFGVTDLDATRAALMDRGVNVSEPVAIPERGGAQCFFKDPTGNLIELNQPPI
jgi:catechol 2,3-dioxygenase-like lactoylglutathione lyase family enzyme